MSSYYVIGKSGVPIAYTFTCDRRLALQRALQMAGIHLNHTKAGYLIGYDRNDAAVYTKNFTKAAEGALKELGYRIKKLRNR